MRSVFLIAHASAWLIEVICVTHVPLSAAMKGSDIDREIRMVITFKRVTEDKFWHALETAVTPLLPKVRTSAQKQLWSLLW